jgi:hypothetical protein
MEDYGSCFAIQSDISLFDFEELAKLDCNSVSSSINSIENQFKLDIDELKKKSVGNKTKTVDVERDPRVRYIT